MTAGRGRRTRNWTRTPSGGRCAGIWRDLRSGFWPAPTARRTRRSSPSWKISGRSPRMACWPWCCRRERPSPGRRCWGASCRPPGEAPPAPPDPRPAGTLPPAAPPAAGAPLPGDRILPAPPAASLSACSPGSTADNFSGISWTRLRRTRWAWPIRWSIWSAGRWRTGKTWGRRRPGSWPCGRG